MDRQLIEFIDGIKSNRQVAGFDEASIKQAIVLRLLFLLGWDIFNVAEVNPNLSGETPHADYALSIKNTRKVFIKVFRPKESLEKYQEKIFEYASKKGVDFAVLTNGVVWWLHLSSHKGNALQNRFAVLDFLNQPSKDIAKEMAEYLKKDEMAVDSAVKKAAHILKMNLQQAAQKAIPDAWTQILSEPNEALIKLIGETAERICGVAAEREAIVQFLNERVKQPQPVEAPPAPKPEEEAAPRRERAAASPEKAAQKSYDGQFINAFALKNKTYKVKSWEELLVKLCEVLKTEHHHDIDSLQWLSVGRKYYFNKNENELRVPAAISGTDIFVETYLSPNEVFKVAQSVLAEFGISGSDLKIS